MHTMVPWLTLLLHWKKGQKGPRNHILSGTWMFSLCLCRFSTDTLPSIIQRHASWNRWTLANYFQEITEKNGWNVQRPVLSLFVAEARHQVKTINLVSNQKSEKDKTQHAYQNKCIKFFQCIYKMQFGSELTPNWKFYHFIHDQSFFYVFVIANIFLKINDDFNIFWTK